MNAHHDEYISSVVFQINLMKIAEIESSERPNNTIVNFLEKLHNSQYFSENPYDVLHLG